MEDAYLPLGEFSGYISPCQLRAAGGVLAGQGQDCLDCRGDPGFLVEFA